MDFMNRATPAQPQPQRPVGPQGAAPAPKNNGHSSRWAGKKDLLTLGGRLGANALLFLVALLVAAVAWFLYSSQSATQARLINTSKLQAVFLNTGQVYFGNIQALNNRYLVLGNVYYLQSNNSDQQQTAANQNISLIKLGCELHKPYDQMVINSDEVTFWENLQPDGQVAKAVAQFQQQNPNGQKCSDQPASTSTGLQNQASPSTNTAPTTKH